MPFAYLVRGIIRLFGAVNAFAIFAIIKVTLLVNFAYILYVNYNDYLYNNVSTVRFAKNTFVGDLQFFWYLLLAGCSQTVDGG